MIIVGLGSNLTTEKYKSSKEILEAAIELLSAKDIKIVEVSNFYETEPVPKSNQPWFVNAVIQVQTSLGAEELLQILHQIENDLGRIRKEKWEARIIDLDLLCYNDLVLPAPSKWKEMIEEDEAVSVIVPHARLHLRDFVLIPMIDIAPKWMHPVFNKNTQKMLEELESVGIVRILSEE